MIDQLNTWDLAIYRLINLTHTSVALDPIMVFLSSSSTWVVAFALSFAAAVLMKRPALLRMLAVLAITCGVTDLICGHVLKPYFKRVRPCHWMEDSRRVNGQCGSPTGMPSNHAANGMAAATVVGFFGGWPAFATAGAVAVAVGYSRVYLGVHHPGDILAGFVFGAFMALIISWLLKGWVREGRLLWIGKSHRQI